MKRLSVFAAAAMLAAGVLSSPAGAEQSDIVVDARTQACVSETVDAQIRIKIRNTTNEPVEMFAEIANRSTAASPPFWRYDPWYTFESFTLDARSTAFVTYDVGFDTIQYYGNWVIKVWKDAPGITANRVYYDGYHAVPACGPEVGMINSAGWPSSS